MSPSNQLDSATVLLLILGTIFVLPLLMMGLGFGGMMGYAGMMGQYGGTGGWWLFAGMLVPLIFLLVLLGGGYLVFQRGAGSRTAQDPAMQELRTAYARGELSEEEFEERRRRLQNQYED